MKQHPQSVIGERAKPKKQLDAMKKIHHEIRVYDLAAPIIHHL